MKKNNPILDDMLFYRRVRKNYDDGRTKRYDYDKNDNLILLKPCFWSSIFESSVYTAILLNCNPHICKESSTDGVASITAREIRSVKIEGYEIDVYLNPIDNSNCVKNSKKWKQNNAHAIIVMKSIRGIEDDEKTKRDLFGDVSRQLCAHSSKRGWTIKPMENE